MARSWPISCLLNAKTDAIDYCLLQSRNNLWLVGPFLSSPVCCLRGRGYISLCMRSLCSFYPDIKWPSRIAIIVCQAESAALYGSNLKNCSFNNSLCIVSFAFLPTFTALTRPFQLPFLFKFIYALISLFLCPYYFGLFISSTLCPTSISPK